jgi:Sugar-binding cellulase-like
VRFGYGRYPHSQLLRCARRAGCTHTQPPARLWTRQNRGSFSPSSQMLVTNRRQFLKETATTLLLGLGTGVPSICPAAPPKMPTSVSRLKRPAAIAMWDFSWLLRHYPTGEFENWDAVLDGLVKRGYNAIRFDVFPALVAPDPQGRVIQEHHFPKSDWKPVMWGGQYSIANTMTRHPARLTRASPTRFSPACRQNGRSSIFSPLQGSSGSFSLGGIEV